MTEGLLIRPAAQSDLPALLALYAQLHSDALDPAPGDAARILGELSRYPGSAVLVGCLGPLLVSTATLVVVPNLTRGGTPYALIENVVTDPDHRGRGFGRKVLRHAVSAAWACGCYKVMLMTGAKDPGTLRFYAGSGFEQSKTGFQVRRVPERGS